MIVAVIWLQENMQIFRFSISALFLAILITALAIKFVPRQLTQVEESRFPTQGTGTYVLFENVRAVITDKESGIDAFAPDHGSGNLIWIEHTCSFVDPSIVGGWSFRKILIQLPNLINEGTEFDIRIPGVDPNSISYQSPDSTAMSDGTLDVFVFNEPEDLYWVSEHRHLRRVHLNGQDATTPPSVLGSVKILEMTTKTVTIQLDLPPDVTMRPESGAIPLNITLNRKKHIAR